MREACDVLRLHPRGEFPVACVGESHYQAALQLVCGSPKEDGENREVSGLHLRRAHATAGHAPATASQRRLAALHRMSRLMYSVGE